MSRKKKPKKIHETVVVEAELDVSPTLQRNADMFFDWINGMSKDAIAEKYQMHVQNVYRISTANKWDSRRSKLIEKMHVSAMQDLKAMVYSFTQALKRDAEMIIESAKKENRYLTGPERDHIAKLQDRYLKETRLDEGKPTEITNETRKVILVLPEGVDDFGVIPPDPRVTLERGKNEEKELEIEDDIDLKKVK